MDIIEPEEWTKYRGRSFFNSLKFYANDILEKDIIFFYVPFSGNLFLVKDIDKPLFAVDFLDNPFTNYPEWVKDRLVGIYFGCGCPNGEYWFNKISVAGFGCVSADVLPCFNTKFDNRTNIAYFRGCLSGDYNFSKNHRCEFFKKIRKILKTRIIATNNDWNGTQVNFNKDQIMSVVDEVSDPIPPYEYLKEMSRYKYALCPFGLGKVTWRLLEAMSQKCLVISDNLDGLNFNRKYFVDGYNYISIDNLKYLDRAGQIAENGYNTYLEYFAPKDGILPLRIMKSILARIRRLVDGEKRWY